MEQVEQKMKDTGSLPFDAIYELFTDKADRSELEYSDFEDMNRAVWAALVHKTTDEACKKVKNTGQCLCAGLAMVYWTINNYSGRVSC